MSNDTGTDERKHDFFIIDNEVVHNYDLNPYEGWLYIVIACHVNHKTGIAFPSLTTLAEKTNMSEPTVVKYLKSLEEKGLLRIDRQYDEDTGANKSNHYRLLGVVKEVKEGGKPALGGVVKEVKSNNTNTNNTNEQDQKSAPVGARRYYADDTLTDTAWREMANGKTLHVGIIEDGYLCAMADIGRMVIEPAPIPRNSKIAVAIQKAGFTWGHVWDCVHWIYDPASKGDMPEYWQKRSDKVPLERIADVIDNWWQDHKPVKPIDFGGGGFAAQTALALSAYDDPAIQTQVNAILTEEGIDVDADAA